MRSSLTSVLVSLLMGLTMIDAQYVSAQKNSSTQDSNPDSMAVRRAAEAFIDAFISLDWERFCNSFADDATVFFPPTAKAPRLANGKTEIEAVFRSVFDNARKQKSSPPYLTIEPKDMRIKAASGIAIVTFHLEDPDSLGRRTIVFEKRGERWLIIHLHASNIASAK